jgi:hypothetical protein
MEGVGGCPRFEAGRSEVETWDEVRDIDGAC